MSIDKTNWPSVMDVIQKDEGKNIKIQRALDAQGKKSALPPEVHEHLHAWWQQNKASALTPEQHQRLGEVKSVKAKRSGMKIVKSNIDTYKDLLKVARATLDLLAKADNEEPKEPKAKKTKKAPLQDWAPREYKAHESAAMKPFIDEGYHPREAAHLAGVESSRPGQSFKATPLSPKMLEMLKPVAKDMVHQFRDERNAGVKPHVNPDLAVAHQTKQIFGKLDNSIDDAVKEFKSSGELEKLSPHERIKAMNQFKADWHAKNLESKTQNMTDVAQQHALANRDVAQQHGKHVLESMRSIAQGGGGGIITPDMQASYQPDAEDYDTDSDVGEYQDEGENG